MAVHAVVLAGRANEGKFVDEGVRWEAELDIAGLPMVVRVIRALRASSLSRVVVVAPADLADRIGQEGAEWVEAGASLAENLKRGAAALPRDEALLVTTSDIPLINGAMVDRFLAACDALEGDFYYPIIRRDASEARYPLVRRTYVTLREGSFTGGNMMLLRPGSLGPILRLLHRVYEARKKPWRLAGILGWSFVLRLLLKNATIPLVEERVRRILGGTRGRAVITPDVEIGLDVDKPDDLRLVRSALS